LEEDVVDTDALATPLTETLPEDSLPAPAAIDTEPPFEPDPAASKTEPDSNPFAVEDPPRRDIEPAESFDDEPVSTEMSPEVPVLLAPVDTITEPLDNSLTCD